MIPTSWEIRVHLGQFMASLDLDNRPEHPLIILRPNDRSWRTALISIVLGYPIERIASLSFRRALVNIELTHLTFLSALMAG